MDQLWLSATSPAIKLWTEGGQIRWRVNLAALEWSLGLGQGHEDWEALARTLHRLRDETSSGRACLGSVAVGWSAVECDPGWLLWLSLDDDPAATSDGVWNDPAQKLSLVQEFGRMGLFERDLRTNEGRWDAHVFRLFGMDPAEDTPNLFAATSRLHPGDRERFLEDHQRFVAEGGRHENRFRLLLPDGRVRHIHSLIEVRNGLDGQPEKLLGVLIDDTPFALELERQQERLSLATQAAGAGIWERELDGRTTYWSDQMYRLRGLDPADPRPIEQLAVHTMSEAQRAELLALTERHVREGTPYERELKLIWPDGSEHWVATVGRVLRDEAGHPLRMTGVNWDITQRKRAEEALRDKEAAERASQAKSEFLARMSHELRTPLNALLGFAELMDRDRQHALPELQQVRLDRIRSAGDHLLALIEDVLDMAALESQRLPLTCEPVELDAAVEDVHQWLLPLATEAGIAIHVPRTGFWALADARRLKQVLSNLLSNAVKYNRPHGEVWLSAQAEGADAQRMLHLVVRDTGRGLSPQQLAHLFEPFNRLGAERDGIEGVGIGLTIVRHLVQSMGGRVEVQSEAGVGSTFHVWLRAAAGALPRPGERLPARVEDTARGLDILYIEDNPVNVLLVEELIALRPGLSLRSAVDGQSGLAQARGQVPDVLLVDMQLPDMDGFEVLRRVRALPGVQGTTVIALSANAMPADVQRARDAGFDDYWTKPIDFDRFLAALDVQTRRRMTSSP